ncbi:hypothetical protein KAR91_83620 [Candidatus Pacearchaeota archaeon]|nr:hypothetical protein [Candidatus Pacearchaeota archaeon]
MKRTVIHYVDVESFTLTSGTESYTIGSGGDFDTVRPVKINGGYVRSGGIDIPLQVVGEKKYRGVSQKSQTGDAVTYLWYNPTWGASELGTIYVYPAAGGTIYLHNLRPLGEPTGLTETVLFPGEYDEPIKWNLALRLAPEYGKKASQDVVSLALLALDQLVNFNASLQVETIQSDLSNLSPGSRGFNVDRG